MKVRILGHDDEAVIASIIPNHVVTGVSQTDEPYVRRAGYTESRALNNRGDRFWPRSSFTKESLPVCARGRRRKPDRL